MRRAGRLATVVLAVAVALTQAACAARSRAERAEKAAAQNRHPGAWPVIEYADYQTDDVDLVVEQRKFTVPVPPLRVYAAVAERLIAHADGLAEAPRPVFLITEGRSPNAFALYRRGHVVVAVNLGMIELLGVDEAMWAALIGHELAHFALGHGARRAERATQGDVATGVAGVVMAAIGIPFGALLADSAVTAADRRYSRDEEHAADALAVAYMRAAGFDPAGALRLQEKLAAAHEARGPWFLSTHPSGEERVARLKSLAGAERR